VRVSMPAVRSGLARRWRREAFKPRDYLTGRPDSEVSVCVGLKSTTPPMVGPEGFEGFSVYPRITRARV